MLASYRRDPRAQHVNRRFLPSRDEILEIVKLLLELFYPGYFGRQDLTDENLGFHVGNLLSTLREKTERQVETCLRFAAEAEGRADQSCFEEACRVTAAFLARLPAVRDMLVLDVQAAYDGDPAASSLDEVILAYPGMLAVTVHRVAHELHVMGVPLMPRIMSEWAHSRSGTDIHPGARIGRSFFIDHATGVVVGETTTIGANVKLYQGVTLGALSIPKDERGRVIRDTKRHPTVEDGVTIYANATVLGGRTVVGADSVVGGSVFVTESVPPSTRVALRPPEVMVRARADADDFVI
jgi:serine O-acetyltransferase